MVVYLIGISKTNSQFQILNNEEVVESERKQLLDDEESEDVEYRPNRKLGQFLKFSKPIAYILLVLLVFVTALPWALPSTFIRPLVTICTGILMLVSEDNLVLSNKILTYIGDISYSLYLIHWPIYAYWKLTCDGNKFLLIYALISSIILAIATFETFEKWYLKLSSTNIGFLVVLLFFCNIILINNDEITNLMNPMGRKFSSLDNITDDMTVDDAIRLNRQWSANDEKNVYAPTCVYESVRTPLGWCRHTGLSEHGKYKMAIIGNSWTANHARMFYQECGYKAKSLLQGSAYGCEPFYPTKQSVMCKANFTDFEQRIRKEKPDYAFIFTRYISIGAPLPKNVKSFDKDPMYQVMKEQMLKLISNIKYKLYILDALPRISGSLGKVAKLVKSGTDPVKIDKMVVRFDEYEMARKRHVQLMKDCKGKCIMVDYVPEFYNNASGTFRYFDERGFSYWTSVSHLSPHGIEHIRHVWTDICKKL